MAYTVHIETRVFIYDTYQEAQQAAIKAIQEGKTVHFFGK
jgi:hypothetical protein